MIYFTGDMHGDRRRIGRAALGDLNEEDTLIVCGDFGFLWDDSPREHRLLQKLGRLGPEVLFIDGTHENFSLLNALPVVEYRGGTAHKVNDRVYHLMRGQIYLIEDKTVFAFGGGEDPAFAIWSAAATGWITSSHMNRRGRSAIFLRCPTRARSR